MRISATLRNTTKAGARVDITTVRPEKHNVLDHRVEVWQFVDGDGLEFPPGSVMLRHVSGYGPMVTVHERRAALPGADLTSAIEAAKEMLRA